MHSTDFEKVCQCDETGQLTHTGECTDGIKTLFGLENIPDWRKENLNRIKMCDRSTKRDVEGSDDLTKDDFELFRKTTETQPRTRQKRSLSLVSKENATQYCSEKIAETSVGRLCAKLGTNVQALVNVCSADIQVGICLFMFWLLLLYGLPMIHALLFSHGILFFHTSTIGIFGLRFLYRCVSQTILGLLRIIDHPPFFYKYSLLNKLNKLQIKLLRCT